MGSSSIDFSVNNIWKSWFLFKRGKKSSRDLEVFTYYLEKNLSELYGDLNFGNYQHGSYKKFIAVDNKRREISVATVRDRVVHRLVYEYLNEKYDKTFIFDVFSCRKGKGLLAAIERTQEFLKRYKSCFVWRADIKKFFDNIDQQTLLKTLSVKIKDNKALNILKKIVWSYRVSERERERE